MYLVVDLKAIKAAVDFVFDKFLGRPLILDSNDEIQYKPIARNDDTVESDNDLVNPLGFYLKDLNIRIKIIYYI